MRNPQAEKLLRLAKHWRRVAREQKNKGHNESATIFYRWADEFQEQYNKENDDAAR